MKKTILSIIGLGMFFISCMSPHGPVIRDSSEVMAELTIAPPTFARTMQTKDRWLTETKVQLMLAMPPMSGLMKRTTGSDPLLADTVMNGLHISSMIEDGLPMNKYMGGMWQMMQPDSLDHHLIAVLGNADNTADSLSPLPIQYSTVTVVIKSGTTVIDSATLMPIHGAQGFMYGANIALPLGTTAHTFTIHATAPQASWRDEANQNRLQAAMDASFSSMVQSVSATEVLLGSTIVTDSIQVELAVTQPQTLWIWNSVSSMPVSTAPASNTTLFVGVKLNDLKSRGNGETIGYSSVTCQLISADYHDSTATTILNPIHGSNGFYYGINMPAPEMSSQGGGSMGM